MGQSDYGDLDMQLSEHMASLRRLAIRLTGNLESSDEIMQECLLRIVRSWDGFQERSAFKTWAITILINVFRNSLAQRPEIEQLEDISDVRQPDPACSAQGRELGRIVAQRVSALPPRQREVLVLLVYEHLSPQDVSQMLNMQLANVYATLYQARRRLRSELAPYLTDTPRETFEHDTRQCDSR